MAEEKEEVKEVKKDRCLAAWIASYNLLLKECGGSKLIPVPVEGSEHPILVFSPNPSPDPGPELTLEERIKAIEESEWARNLARGICTKLVGLEPGTPEYEKCVKNVARRAAIGLVT